MSIAIYMLCAAVSAAITWALWQHHRETRSRLLYWSALCFAGLTFNNILLVCEDLLFAEYDLKIMRQIAALGSLCVLLFGLIYEDE